MFPNSILGRPPFTPNHQQHNFFALSPTLYSHQQLIDSQFNFHNADLSRAVSVQRVTYGNVSPIQTSTSPLFRGRNCVEFDLNVNNIVGIRNTFLLRTYAYLENRVRPLVLVIKKWASHHAINDASRGTLSSYSLVLMALHYLQTLPEPILPSLQKIYPESFSPAVQLHLVHQTPCNVHPYLSKNESSLGDLLLGFLKYYATEFDWDSQMISVREAKAIPRPDGMEWRNKYICVEEPFDGTNTARAVHEKQKFDMIKDQFLKSWQRLKNKRDLNSILPLRTAILKR
ncbi:poly(A) RNA polymerase GLD2 isoform 12-T12 [Ctenodactylus gundi]